MRIWWAVMLQHLIFNLRLHLNLHLSDKQHLRSLALLSSLFAVLGWRNSALPWICQYLFIEISCSGCLVLSRTKPSLEIPTKHSAPFLWVRGSKELSKLEVLQLMWELKEAQKDLLSSYGKPMAGSTNLCAVVTEAFILPSSQFNFFPCTRTFKTKSYRFYRKEPEGKIWFLVQHRSTHCILLLRIKCVGFS